MLIGAYLILKKRKDIVVSSWYGKAASGHLCLYGHRAAAALGELRRHADAEHPARDRDPVCVYHVLYQNFSRQIRAEKAESVREAYERQN